MPNIESTCVTPLDSTPHPEPVTHAQFMAAAAGNDVATLRRYLEQGGNVDQSNDAGDTALLVATRAGHEAFLAELLDASPKFQAHWEGSAQEVAVRTGRADLVAAFHRAMVTRTYPISTAALAHAVAQGDMRTVRRFLAQGDGPASFDGALETALFEACVEGRYSIAVLLLSAGADPHIALRPGPGWTPLEAAAQYGFTRIVRLLLAHPGADVPRLLHPHGRSTPLLLAAQAHHLEMVTLLLGAGAKPYMPGGDLAARFAVLPNVGCPDPAAALATLKILLAATRAADLDAFSANDYDRTLLHVAAKNDASWAIAPLVEHGLPVDAVAQRWNGKTPFLDACAAGSIVSLRCLAAHGADIGHRTADGRSALRVAVDWSSEEAFRRPLEKVLDCLLDLGCDPEAPDPVDGQSPLARVVERPELVHLMVAHAARQAMRAVLATDGSPSPR